MASELVVVGLSHRTAPIEVRERLAVSDDALDGSLRALHALPSIGEALLLSTCNRVEVFAVPRAAGEASAAAVADDIRRHLASARRVDAEALRPILYRHEGPAAVKHVFRVAASLDSLVVGEPQILGQLKAAYAAAASAGCVGPLLGRCLERAFAVAKRVRSETAIARGAANVSSVAVELARSIFGTLDGKSVLVLGAGKMSDLAARHLRDAGASRLVVANRSPVRAQQLATRVGGVPRAWEELEQLLVGADVVISSTGATEPFVGRELMRRVMKARRHRPVFIVDIAVPRDVDPRAGQLDGVYLFDIDDLEKVVVENRQLREAEAGSAERIVEAETAQFLAWLRSQGVVPTIKDLRERFRQVAAAEVERTLASIGRGLDPKAQDAIRQLGESIVGKLLHTPLMALKHSDEDVDVLVAATRRLFALPGDDADAGDADGRPSGSVAAGGVAVASGTVAVAAGGASGTAVVVPAGGGDARGSGERDPA